MLQNKQLFTKAKILILLSVVFIGLMFALGGCTSNQQKHIVVDQLPNTVVENSTVCAEYSDIANSMSSDLIDEFMQITKVPHTSGHLDQITSYLQNKLKNYNLTPQMDEVSKTIYVDVPATNKPECQNKPTVILQAHTDMVGTASDDNSNFDFLTSPLDVVNDTQNNEIHSKDYKTNIGADDGHGMALMLAIAKNKDSFDHGNIRFLFTQDEETNCIGAKTLTPSVINSDYLINVDGYQIGNVLCSSAGTLTGYLQKDFEPAQIESGDKLISIKWNGLAGGHTGVDVTKKRVHASSAVLDCFKRLDDANIPYKIAYIQTGNLQNAYSSSFTIKYYLNDKYYSQVQEIAQKMYDEYKKNMTDEDDFNFEITNEDSTLPAISSANSTKIVKELSEVPEGVIEESQVNKDIPKTSSASGIFTIENNHLKMSFMIRSSSNESLDKFQKEIQQNAQDKQLQLTDVARMNGWDYKEDNPMATLMLDSYKNVGNFEGEKTITHGGLEASYFIEKRPTLHMVSIGVDMIKEHMVQETMYTKTINMHIASVLYALQHISN